MKLTWSLALALVGHFLDPISGTQQKNSAPLQSLSDASFSFRSIFGESMQPRHRERHDLNNRNRTRDTNGGLQVERMLETYGRSGHMNHHTTNHTQSHKIQHVHNTTRKHRPEHSFRESSSVKWPIGVDGLLFGRYIKGKWHHVGRPHNYWKYDDPGKKDGRDTAFRYQV